jgi:gamma-glutamylcyclotransferase (GGCT)/AIG2-like uncharacterized protein YtfP
MDGRREFVCSALAEGQLYDIGEYPGFIEAPGIVKGELYKINDASLWIELDAFEAYDPGNHESEYLRKEIILIKPKIKV